jgi:hypothetical protein
MCDGSSVVPGLAASSGQLDHPCVFDRVLTDAERRTSQEAPSQSWPPPRAVPRAQARHTRPAARCQTGGDQQFARWVMLHVQSNLLPICTRPRVLIKGKRT